MAKPELYIAIGSESPFDEQFDSEADEYSKRNVPDSPARDAALGVMVALSDRFHLEVGDDNELRAEIVDEVTAIVECAHNDLTKGPWTYNTMLGLNEVHATATQGNLDYSVGYSPDRNSFDFKLRKTVVDVPPSQEVDSLYFAVKLAQMRLEKTTVAIPQTTITDDGQVEQGVKLRYLDKADRAALRKLNKNR